MKPALKWGIGIGLGALALGTATYFLFFRKSGTPGTPGNPGGGNSGGGSNPVVNLPKGKITNPGQWQAGEAVVADGSKPYYKSPNLAVGQPTAIVYGTTLGHFASRSNGWISVSTPGGTRFVYEAGGGFYVYRN